MPIFHPLHFSLDPTHHSVNEPVKVGDWHHHGQLVHHSLGFFQDHSLGTFHHLNDGIPLINLPSDQFGLLKLKI